MHKVCHLSTVHSPNDTRIFHKEILSLVSVGYRIIFIVRKGESNLDHSKVSYKFLENPKNLVERITNIVKAFLMAFEEKCSIYHFHDPELIPVGVLLKILTRQKVIYDIHELYSDALLYKPYLGKNIAKYISKFYIIIEKYALKFFDHIILAEEIYKDYYKGKNYTVIQNFLPQKYITTEKKHFIENNVLNFVYLGGVSKVRAVEQMLNFALILKDVLQYKLHLIGPVQSFKLKQKICIFMESNDLENHICLYDRIAYHEAQDLLKGFDIGLLFLYPIQNYSFVLSTKMFEYMGKGLPVIMNNLPLWEEFNKKFNCGLTINIFDMDKEKEKILSFLCDKDRLQEISKNNVETVKNYFTWEIEEVKLLELYNKLLNNSCTFS